MAILTREQLTERMRSVFGDDTSDETLNFIGDITDTVTDYETRIQENADFKKKFEDNDKEWRKKFKERFFSGVETPPEPSEPTPKNKITFEELFTERN